MKSNVSQPDDGIEFSVILIAYNLESCLGKAIHAVLKQEFKNFELIIVNDGSTDGTLQVAMSFQDTRINVICQENGGASHARNTGLKAARGKYVAFLDGDDYWYPDHLQMAFEFFRKHPGVRAYAARYAWAQEDNIPCRKELSCSFVVRKLGLRGLVLFWNPLWRLRFLCGKSARNMERMFSIG